MRYIYLVGITGLILCSTSLLAQDTATYNKKLLEHINKKYNGLTQLLSKNSSKAIEQLQRQEKVLIAKLSKQDSSKAKQLQLSSTVAYNDLPNQLLQAKGNSVAAVRNYIPALDSV